MICKKAVKQFVSIILLKNLLKKNKFKTENRKIENK